MDDWLLEGLAFTVYSSVKTVLSKELLTSNANIPVEELEGVLAFFLDSTRAQSSAQSLGIERSPIALLDFELAYALLHLSPVPLPRAPPRLIRILISLIFVPVSGPLQRR